MKVVLFDIDGTMLTTHGAGRRALERAMHEEFSATGQDGYHYDGKTDRQIVREQMRVAGLSDEAIDAGMDTIISSYLNYLRQELTHGPERATLLTGVVNLLDGLRDRSDVMLGLLTGNVRDGARHKLRAVGVDFDQFLVSAFGSDHEHRPELPEIARSRAQVLLNDTVQGSQLVIIGDTPADIACGRSIGTRAIAVATGRYSVSELASHEPTAVFASLHETSAVIEAILA